MWRTVLLLPVAILLQLPAAAGQQPLTRLDGCRLVSAAWADGDSFPVQTGDGKELTIRLYGADCLEWHVADDSDARRLRAQRRYFGIAQVESDPQKSITVAKGFGETAGLRVRELLSRPFTVFTAYADARGDGKHQRVYGFVQLDDGRDLSRVLVEEGLARAFGVSRSTPAGESADEYREALRDLELQAARLGHGIWARTNWQSLPEERRIQRQEEAELALASGRPKIPDGTRLDPNTAARDELMMLPGLGEELTNRIIEARPFGAIDDLLRVQGIGAAKLDKIRPYLEIRDPR